MNIAHTCKLSASASAFAIITALSACTSSGGGGDTATSTPIQKSGNVLADGYLQFATVCLDTNKDNSCDGETSKTESNTTGDFTLSALATQYQQFAILAESNASTTDDNGAITEKLVLSTPPGKTEPTTGDITVSPLTTIVQGYLQANLGLSTAAAEQQIKDNLGVESSSVSLFDDYIEQLKQLSSTPTKPIASGAIATGALTNTQAYTLFDKVAQVTSVTIQKAIAKVTADAAATNSVANIDLGAQLDSLIAVIIEDVVNSLPALVTAIGNIAPDAVFDPAALVTIDIDLTTLTNAITNQEQINTATATGMQAILEDGLNFFNIDFFSELSSFAHDKITLNQAGNALIGTFTEFNPNNPSAGFVTAQANNNNPGSFYLDATTGWTQEPADDITGSAVTINADGSADIVTAIDSFSISGAVSDVVGQRVADYAPLELQPSLTGSTKLFTTGAKAIRFSGSSLSVSHFLFADSPVSSNGGNGPQALQLSDIITASAFDLTTNTDADPLNDANPVGDIIGCEPLNNKCIAIEFVSSNASGNVGTSGTANYYLFDFVNRNPTGFHSISKLADTSSWTISTISTEDILKTSLPASVRNQLLGFNSFDNESSGILFSVAANSSGQQAVRRGDFSVVGDAFVDTNWAFNDTAATDVEEVIINDLNSGTVNTGTGNAIKSLAANTVFTTDLFQTDASLGTINNATGASFTRVSDFTAPTSNAGTLDLQLNLFSTPGTLLTPIEFERITINTGTPNLFTSATIDQITGIATGATSTGNITILNGDMLISLSDDVTSEAVSLHLIPVQPTTDPSGSTNSVNVVVVFTVFGNTGNGIQQEGIITGSLQPSSLP